MCCITIDLHSDCFTVARRKDGDSNNNKVVKKYFLEDDSFTKFKSTLTKDDYVAVEATTNAFWFHDQLKPYVEKVIVLDTNKINFDGNKTDSNDAKKLLDILEYFIYIKGENEIPQVYIPKEEVRKLRELFATHSLLKKIVCQLKNRAYSLLKQHGKIIKKSSLGTKHGRKLALEIIDNKISQIEIELLLNQIENLEADIKVIAELLASIGKEYFEKEIELITTIPGFSFFTALALMSDIADINRFPTAKKYCSYLRVAPKIKESNKTTHIGHINRNSRSLTLSLITQSVGHFRHCSNYFEDFYDRLRAGKGYGKTRIAIIRKILVCTYYMLKRNETFRWSKNLDLTRKRNLFEQNAERGKYYLSKVA